MQNRPTSIMVIAWIIIILAVINLIVLVITLNNNTAKELMTRIDLLISMQQAFVGALISILSAIMMLKGKNWGRLLYIFWIIIGFIIALITHRMKLDMFPGTIVVLAIIFFLFRPAANGYFARQ